VKAKVTCPCNVNPADICWTTQHSACDRPPRMNEQALTTTVQDIIDEPSDLLVRCREKRDLIVGGQYSTDPNINGGTG
jgi:hypothetical protein